MGSTARTSFRTREDQEIHKRYEVPVASHRLDSG